MTGFRHATDRTDWTIIAECPYNGHAGPMMAELDLDEPPEDCTHIALEADATNADMGPREAIPLDRCPLCDAELVIISQEKPTEVLR